MVAILQACVYFFSTFQKELETVLYIDQSVLWYALERWEHRRPSPKYQDCFFGCVGKHRKPFLIFGSGSPMAGKGRAWKLWKTTHEEFTKKGIRELGEIPKMPIPMILQRLLLK